LELGQGFLDDFFFDDQVPESPLEIWMGCVSCGEVVTVDVEEIEEFDPREEEELDR
jgi:hypothetical protein